MRDQFAQANVGLYRLDDMIPLYNDIQLRPDFMDVIPWADRTA